MAGAGAATQDEKPGVVGKLLLAVFELHFDKCNRQFSTRAESLRSTGRRATADANIYHLKSET